MSDQRPFYVQLVKTTGWYKENQQSSWGIGIQVDRFGGCRYGRDEADDRREPAGWQIQIQLGMWALFIQNHDGWVSLHGPGWHPQPFFEVVRP